VNLERCMTEVPEYCKGAVLTAYGRPLELRDVQVPRELEPGALLVRMSAATVCASDFHLQDGTARSEHAGSGLPLILGHEMVGAIVSFGVDADHDSVGRSLRRGDRIVWTHGFCGSCYNCVIAREATMCTNRRGYMNSPYTEYPFLTGGFVEYGYVFPTSGRLKLPDELSNDVASAASCAGRTVIHGFARLGEFNEDSTVVIQGSGPLGLFATARAAVARPRRLVVVGGPSDRLALAQEWGATHTIDVADTPDVEDRALLLQDYTDGRGADVVIEVSGAPTAFSEGLRVLATNGRYLLIGLLRPTVTAFDASQLVLKQIRLIGSFSGTVKDYHRILQFVTTNSSRFSWGKMIGTHFALADINEALTAMRRQTDIKPAISFAS
jgi:L-iditol 2-dehydrogenase